MIEMPTALIKYILKRDYYLNEKDANDIVKLYSFSVTGSGLSEKEINFWKGLRVINSKNQVMFDRAFITDDVILPAFWLKLVMMKKGMLFLAWDGQEHEITRLKKNEL